jgi:hypothetical protein
VRERNDERRVDQTEDEQRLERHRSRRRQH